MLLRILAGKCCRAVDACKIGELEGTGRNGQRLSSALKGKKGDGRQE
jgi:hypothetical protein